MDDDSEKMRALKKAYAEIILNMSKEAAEKILVSERNAQQLQRDLAWTKEEALRLLLRLKQTMDSKLNDAEIKSLHQQSRINELEAQLQEAEDIVGDLRAELDEVHMRVAERERNQKLSGPHTIQKAVCEQGMKETINDPFENGLVFHTKGLHTINGDCATENSLKDAGYADVPFVPSIIRKTKKPALYRNGCTQRIRAYAGNVLNDHFPLSGELDDHKDEKTLEENKEEENLCMIPPTSADVTCIVGKKHADIMQVKNVDKTQSNDQYFISFRKKKKRAVKSTRLNASEIKPIPPMALTNVEHVVPIQGGDESVEAHTNAVVEDREIASSLVLIKQQSGFGDLVDASSLKPELALQDVASTNLDVKGLDSVETLPSPQPKDRSFKYTFQRKRKKGALSSDDSSSLSHENPLKKQMRNKQNDDLQPPKSVTRVESPRESQRMEELARQLISLSENKWW